jgi:pimeloyl-ACP methyl ester carboxylesterase
MPPCILFLHGFNCDSTVWRQQVPYFENRFDVFTPELPFHKETELTAFSSVEGLADATVRFIQEELQEPPVVVGHSLGGMVALQMALRAGNAQRAVVLADAFPSLRLCEKFLPMLFTPHTPPDVRRKVTRMMEEGRARMSREAHDRLWDSIETMDVSDRLEEIKLPVLGVYGGRGRYQSSDSERLKRDLVLNRSASCNVAILEGAGHFVQLERPEAFNEALDAFVAGLDAR